MPQQLKRVKVRRRDLRQPDEFVTLTARAVAWARAHRRLWLATAAVLATLTVAALVMVRTRSARAYAASEAFRSAYATFEAGKFGEAAAAFQSVGESYPATAFGQLAVLYRGYALGRQGDVAGAAAAYAQYLAATSGPAHLRQTALAALGGAKEGTGDMAGALEAYQQAADLGGPRSTEALLGAARAQEALGHAAEARALYERLQKGAPDAEVQALVVSKLAESAPAQGSGGNVR
jgi:tetratricopeptide (TPR) repeat protein